MKNIFLHLSAKFPAVFAVAAGSLVMASAANAAIDASVGTALTAIQTDATSLSAIVVPIVVSVMGLVIVIKLIKRFGNKI